VCLGGWPEATPAAAQRAARGASSSAPATRAGPETRRYLSLGLPLADVLILADELGTADFFDASEWTGCVRRCAR